MDQTVDYETPNSALWEYRSFFVHCRCQKRRLWGCDSFDIAQGSPFFSPLKLEERLVPHSSHIRGHPIVHDCPPVRYLFLL